MSNVSKSKRARRERLKRHIRKKISGTPERPRLSVYRSLKHIHAQLIDDVNHVTLFSTSSMKEDILNLLEQAEEVKVEKKGKSKKKKIEDSKNIKFSKAVGLDIGKLAMESGIKSIIFDRSGYRYHGRVKALADGARKAGLKF